MNVEVKLFAVARQLAERDEVVLELPDGASVALLRRKLVEVIPALGEVIASIMIAVNAEYADDNSIVPADAEVACIPPVSGG